jgi:hypothetical protein
LLRFVLILKRSIPSPNCAYHYYFSHILFFV